MKKNLLSGVLTLTMILALAVPAMAADNTKNSELTYTVASTFTITIPPTVTLTDGTGSSEIKVEGAMIPHGQSLTVKITGAANYDTTNSKFRLKDGSNENYIGYTIKNGSTEVKKGDAVLTVAAGNATGDATLTYTADAATKAGTYMDTLTFTAAIA